MKETSSSPAPAASVWRAGLQTAFHLLYNQLAWSYDAVSAVVSAGKWQEWQRSALPFVRGPRVLELGHGPGHTLLELEQAGYVVTGLDLSRAMGRMARRRGKAAGRSLAVVRGRAQALPFPAAAFDTVLSLFPTPYVVDPATLQEIRRVLAPGGRLVILPEARLAPASVSNRMLERLYRLTGQRPTQPEAAETTREDAAAAYPAYWAQALTASSHWSKEQLTVKRITVADSTVLLIIAEQPVADERSQ